MELLTPKDIKKTFRCSLAMVYKMAERGQIPCIRIPCLGDGKKRSRDMIRFKKEDVLDFIETHYRPTDY